MSERRGRIHEKHELSKTRRCELLDVPRSSAYYRGEPASEADLAVMRLIDEIYLQWPFYGSRRMRDELEERGHTVNRKRVQRLMRQMGLRALYPRRRTSQPGKGHKIYPYLLRDLSIERANQAWASDISYIPMAKGFMYLVAIMDWYSRRVLSWRVSNTLDADFCIEALEEALQRFEAPEIFNTDQGSQWDRSKCGNSSLHTRAGLSRGTQCSGSGVSNDARARQRPWISAVSARADSRAA